MERRKLSIFGLLSLAVVSLVGSVASTIAWFRETVDLTPDVVTGSVQGAYYAGGDGTSGSPFQIHDPIHLYNLAWLQYFGLYNEFENDELEQQYYFVVTADLDMTGWTLPPIGTEDYPFLGKFDGGGHTITGLTSTNDFGSGSGVKTPQKFTGFGGEYNRPQIVGFFGVVGKLPGDEYTYTSANNQMINVTLNGTKVESRTPQTLIGIAAGYVNATMSGVKVSGAATIDVNGNTASTAVDSANITENLSDYGLVGYTANTGGSSTYQQKLSAYYSSTDSTGTGPGSQNEWGGSINMRSLNMRLYNLMNAPNDVKTDDPSVTSANAASYYGKGRTKPTNNLDYTTPALKGKTVYGYKGYQRFYYDDFNTLSIQPGSTASSLNRNPEQEANLYRLAKGGTYAQNTASSATYATIKMPDTVLPLAVDTKEEGYKTLSNNTGYITGGMTGSGSYYAQTTVRTASTLLTYIGNSISSNGASSANYVKSKLEVLTASNPESYSASSFARISDEYNSSNGDVSSAVSGYGKTISSTDNLKKYNASRDQLDEVLEGQSFIHGLHFTGNDVSVSDNAEIASAVINGQTFSNYQLPNNSVTFNLKESGYINFFAGSYQHNAKTVCDSFFSLHLIKRNNSHQLVDAPEISSIYPNINSTTNKKFPYVYQFTNGTTYAGQDNGVDVAYTKGDTAIFDMRYLWNGPPVHHALYYFEIPVNSGEFAMGSYSGRSAGAYLIYLDIGANGDVADTDSVKAYSITTIRNGNLYPTGVDFAPVTVAGAGGESMGLSIAASKKGILTLTVTTSPANIAITDASSIAEYAFQGTKYSATSPPSGYFSMSGNLPTPMVVHPAGGERVLTISLTTVDDDEYDVRITDQLDAEGSIDASTYELDSGSGYASSSASAIEALSEEIVIADLRALEIAATLTRASGKGEFVTTYDTENCSVDSLDVDIALNGTTIGIAVSTGYTFKIGGIPYADSSTYSSS